MVSRYGDIASDATTPRQPVVIITNAETIFARWTAALAVTVAVLTSTESSNTRNYIVFGFAIGLFGIGSLLLWKRSRLGKQGLQHPATSCCCTRS